MLQSIRNLDLEKVRRRLIRKEGLTEAEAELALAEYRQYLQLCKDVPGVSHTPSPLGDKAWHAHILHTHDYFRDCEAVFGFYLHHLPHETATCGACGCNGSTKAATCGQCSSPAQCSTCDNCGNGDAPPKQTLVGV